MIHSNDWQRCQLSELTKKTGTWSREQDPREAIRYVDVSSVSREELQIVDTTPHSYKTAPSRARKVVRAGDTIVATVRPTLRRMALVPATLDGEIVSTAFCVLRPNVDRVTPDFLFFATQLDSFVDSLASVQTGASYPAVRDSDVLERTISVPTLAEQRSITEVLNLSRTTLLHERSCEAQAIDCKRAAMGTLFSKGLRGEEQKDTEIGPVPKTWDVVEFSSVRQWLQYGTSVHCTYERSEHPVLRIPNVESGRINTQDLKFAVLGAAEAQKYRLQNGDLIFIRTNGVIDRLGICAVYSGAPSSALFASYLIRARLRVDRVSPHFLAHFFGSGQGTSIISGRATPASDGKYNLNTATIDSLPMPLPPTLDEQNEIVAVLASIDAKIDLHRRKRAVLEDLFKVLLHKLMTGDIRVADLDVAALAPQPTAEAAQ